MVGKGKRENEWRFCGVLYLRFLGVFFLGKVKKTKCSDAINVGFITDWELESRDEFTVLITTLHKNVIQFISYN